MIAELKDKTEIDRLNEKCWSINRTEPQNCIIQSRDILFAAQKINYPKGIAHARASLGAALVWLSNYDDALTSLFVARNELKTLGDKTKEADVVYHIFCCFYYLEDYDNSIDYSNQVLALAISNNNEAAEASAYNALGTIYYTIGENKKSIENLEKGLLISQKINDNHLLARILDGLGTAWLQLNEVEKALNYKEKALAAARESKIKNIEGYALSGLAKVHQELNNYKQAEEFILESIRIRKEIKFKPGIAEGLSSLGSLYLLQNKVDEALPVLEEALNLSEEIDSHENLYKTHEALAKYHEAKNNLTLFKKHFELYFQYKEQHLSDQHLQKIRTSEMQMKMTQMEKEKNLLEKKHQELENQSRDLELLSSLGKKITSFINIEAINKTVYEILNTIMDATGFGIGVMINEGKNLEFPGYIEEGHVHKSAMYDLSDNDRLATICYNKELEILISDFDVESEKYVKRSTAPVVGKSVQSLIYLPLKTEKGKIGVITVQSFEKNAYSEYHLNLLKNLAIYCAIAVENASNYEKLEEMVKERTAEIENAYTSTRLLSEISKDISSSLSVEKIIEKVYHGVSQILDIDGLGIGLYQESSGKIYMPGYIEKGKRLDDFYYDVDDNRLASICFKNQKEIFISNYAEEYHKYLKGKQAPVAGKDSASIIYLPLYLQEKITGIITVQSFKVNAFTDYHIDLLKNLAQSIASSLENARLYESLEEKVNERTKEVVKQKEQIEKAARNTKLISEIGKEISASLSLEDIIALVYKRIDALMSADAFGIGIYRKEQNDLFHTGVMEKGIKLPDFSFPLSEERIAIICFEKGQEIIINDWNLEHKKYVKHDSVAIEGESPVSIIYIPLFSNNRKIGVMSVQSFHANAYSENDLDILRSLAIYTASALENASLYHSLEEKVAERTAEIEKAYDNTRLISQISKDISSSLSVETIIEKVYHSVNQLMDATGFGIGIYDSNTQRINMPGYIEKGEKLENFHYDIKDERLATWCFNNKKEIFINDYSIEYKNFLKGMKAPVAGKDSASILYLPLYLKDEVMGILTIQSFEKNVYSEYHLDILRGLATSIASAIDNARLYENMEEEVKERTKEVIEQKEQIEKTFANTKLISEIGREISALLSIDDIISKLYTSVNSIIDASIFGVAVYRKDENDLFFSGVMEQGEKLPDFSYSLNDERIATICFKENREITINDWANEYHNYVKQDYDATQGGMPESMIYIPILSKNNVLGVITTQTFRKNAYNNYHIDILRSLSVYVGSAIENASLYHHLEEKVIERTEEIEKAYQDTKLLSQISKEISASLSIETIVTSVYKHVNSLMDAASFGIGIYDPITENINFPGFMEKGEKLGIISFNVNDDRLASWCFKNQKEIVTNDYSKEFTKYVKGIKAVVAGKHSSSIVYLPLFNKERIIGVLTIQSYQLNAYSEYQVDILRNLANSISIAIDNATLYSHLEEKVRERTSEVVKQKEIIEEKNKHITDSIIYAKRIQEAILPPEDFFSDLLKNSFVLYKPKDIVSGDFYWIERKDNKILFSVVDCTGHGVPGAFMSIIGYNGLNQIVNEYNVTQPAQILNHLNKIISQTLKQKADESKIRDGMDISVCCIDFENNKLEFAGANNPIFIVRNNEVLEIKADKHPIGNFVGEEEFQFTNKEIDLYVDDRLYLFSDGYADQFGGPRGKKFKYSQFRSLLIEHHQKPMNEQKYLLDDLFEEWRGDLEQIDDVCVIGVRIS